MASKHMNKWFRLRLRFHLKLLPFEVFKFKTEFSVALLSYRDSVQAYIKYLNLFNRAR